MRKRNVIITLLFILTSIHVAKAQIGYQVSLLNTATGEARANETVTVTVSLSNSAGEIFYNETKQSTTNDFGVLSLTVGNADTFKNVDLTKMPFYIEVTANGVMIGKSQMLSVPVAEVAKQVAPLDKSLIVGTIWKLDPYTLTFKEDGKVTYGSGDNIYGEYKRFCERHHFKFDVLDTLFYFITIIFFGLNIDYINMIDISFYII